MSHFKVVCPQCQGTKQLRKHGRNRGKNGQARYFCAACQRAFTPQAKARGLSPEKEQLILKALKEGMSYSAITRTFSCSFSTIYALLKKP